MPPSTRRIKNASINQEIADDIKFAMTCLKISSGNNNLSSSLKLLPSAITNYSVCNQTLIAIPSPTNSTTTITDYDNQVLFVVVDMYEEDWNKPNSTQCVICKDSVCIPKITKCGHIFCYACIVGYMVACGSTQLVKCPLCSRWIHAPELKSLIWRNIVKLTVGDNIKFHLYRYNMETSTVERIRGNLDRTTTATRRSKSYNNNNNSHTNKSSRHTFEYLWNHVKHIGNGQLYIDQIEHQFILPDNNIYFVNRDRENNSYLTLFDIEKSIIIDRINDIDVSTEEMVSYLACNDHFNDFIDRLTKQYESFVDNNPHTLPSTNVTIFKSTINISSLSTNNKKTMDCCNDVVTTTTTATIQDNYNNQTSKKVVPIVPLVKPEFIKTPRDLKNRSNPTDENDYRFKKYLFFYKNETYFNTYMANINCYQIVNYLMENTCVYDDQLHLPINVEGVLLHVENYEPESTILADSTWKYCSSMVKFLGFCNLKLIHPYEFEVPHVDAIQYKYSIKTQPSNTNNNKNNNNNNNNNNNVISSISSVNSDDVGDAFRSVAIETTRNTHTPYPSQPTNNSFTLQHSTLSEVYPDLKSYYYDYFGNKNDDFPSFD